LQIEFWNRSKWLQKGTLLALISAQGLFFAEVATRDVRELAADRPLIGIRACNQPDTERVLLELGAISQTNKDKKQTEATEVVQKDDGQTQRGKTKAKEQARQGKMEKDGARDTKKKSSHAACTVVQVGINFSIASPVLQSLKELVCPIFAEEIFLKQPSSHRVSPEWEIDPEAAPYIQQQLNTFDESQQKAFEMALTQSVSLIQGPPGTGKTRVGIATVRALLVPKEAKVLVICFTNHALDCFLEGLLDAGVHKEAILRFGGRTTSPRVEELSLFKLLTEKENRESMGRAQKARNYTLRVEIEALKPALEERWKRLRSSNLWHPSRVHFNEVEQELEVCFAQCLSAQTIRNIARFVLRKILLSFAERHTRPLFNAPLYEHPSF
jgi:hypothetical protein